MRIRVVLIPSKFYESIDQEEVSHVDYEHDKGEPEIPHIASSNTLAIKNTVVVGVVDADIA